MDDTRTMKERMLAGEPYMPDESTAADARKATELMHRINSAGPHADLRAFFTDLLGEYGADTFIRPPFYCDYGYNITIGERCFANFGLTVLDVARVSIGDDVQFGPHVQLLTPTHPIEPQARRDKWEGGSPITIGDNVWLGGGVVVCPGVTIGSDTVVGAGSVVVKDLPPRSVAVGSPARVVRTLE